MVGIKINCFWLAESGLEIDTPFRMKKLGGK
jgi:hypothetical protein